MSDLLFLYLVRPHLGDVSICLLDFSALHYSIMHDVCMYVSIYVCVCVCVCVRACTCVGDCALCMTNSHGYVSDFR